MLFKCLRKKNDAFVQYTLLCIWPLKVTQSHGCGRMDFYGVGINERVELTAVIHLGWLRGLMSIFTASKIRCTIFHKGLCALFVNYSKSGVLAAAHF